MRARYGALRLYLGVDPAILVSSGVFGLLPGSNASRPFTLVVTLVIGAVAALLYEHVRFLWPPVALHVALNLAAVSLARLPRLLS